MRSLVCLLLLSQCITAAGRDVPLKKAIPPLMDPIPTLPDITHRVYLDISIDGDDAERVVIGLFGDLAPRTVENFRVLATCSHATPGKLTGRPLCYKNTIFHRIIPHFGLQGGDFSHHDGTGGESIYGGRFQAEALGQVPLNKPFLVAMAATNEVGSQFFITTVKTQWLSGKHSVFGIVVDGRDVIDKIETWGTYGGTPQGKIEIVGCGEEPLTAEDKKPRFD